MQYLRILSKYGFAHLFMLVDCFFLPFSRFLLICFCWGFFFVLVGVLGFFFEIEDIFKL